MSEIVARIKQLGFSNDDYVVIGSGLLDVLKLRTAHDLDVVVSAPLFEKLAAEGEYDQGVKYDTPVLVGVTDSTKDIEVWTGWSDGLSFDALMDKKVVVQGVNFAHPETIIAVKQARGLEKDIRDIQLLKEHYGYEK